MAEERSERDALGEVRIPAPALWGPETQRAIDNFPVSGAPMPAAFLTALAWVKGAAAAANAELGRLDAARSEAIQQAAEEMAAGHWSGQFPVDIFQTGSGTSTHMNANEVLARRAASLLAARGTPLGVDAHDHVNLGQSSNDVIPTALHVAAAVALHEQLRVALLELSALLASRGREFEPIVKSGRTHLQDAAPLRLGQEFSGYAAQVEAAAARVEQARDELLPLALGGTAVGTGLNCPPGFASRVIGRLAARTHLPFREAANHFAAQGAMDPVVAASGTLRSVAVTLYKIANDIRWLSSGPAAGLGEVRLPAVQPGSSIMPGKVNPVICESLLMVACQVVGNDAAIALGGMGGNFELNTFLPLLCRNLLESIELLARGARNFAARAIAGLSADAEHIAVVLAHNTMLATGLVPRIGHAAAVAIAQEAAQSGRTVREVAQERRVLPDAELERLLDPRRMTEPPPG
jgi:fumarate hydratase, class II